LNHLLPQGNFYQVDRASFFPLGSGFLELSNLNLSFYVRYASTWMLLVDALKIKYMKSSTTSIANTLPPFSGDIDICGFLFFLQSCISGGVNEKVLAPHQQVGFVTFICEASIVELALYNQSLYTTNEFTALFFILQLFDGALISCCLLFGIANSCI